MTSKPEFKQHHFQCLHNLKPSFQKVLGKVVKDHLPLKEMKQKANDLRALENTLKAFTKCTRLSWEESAEKYPWHTKDDRLKQFLGLNFVKSVPQTFVDYCKAAMKRSHLQGASSNTYMSSCDSSRKYQWRHYKCHSFILRANLIISYVPTLSDHRCINIKVFTFYRHGQSHQ